MTIFASVIAHNNPSHYVVGAFAIIGAIWFMNQTAAVLCDIITIAKDNRSEGR